jgi:hypothetical protein
MGPGGFVKTKTRQLIYRIAESGRLFERAP